MVTGFCGTRKMLAQGRPPGIPADEARLDGGRPRGKSLPGLPNGPAALGAGRPKG